MKNNKYQPISSEKSPRFADIATFMRLPHISLEEADKLCIGIIGVPWDSGTTNRAGARHGPRQIRDMSSLMRRYHPSLNVCPYDLVNCADLGDCPVNPLQIEGTLEMIENFYTRVIDKNIVPLSAGGDHLVTLPILRALYKKHGTLGMIQFDSHSDLWDIYFGQNRYSHGTPFRRAIEEGILDPKRLVQIGLRGSLYDAEDNAWGLAQGVRQITIEEFFNKGVERTMIEALAVINDAACYVSFDIDSLDPVYAPGTGTPEIGGYTSAQAQQMLRKLRGLNLVGADMVEVSPPFDPSGLTALTGATLLFELLCLLADKHNN